MDKAPLANSTSEKKASDSGLSSKTAADWGGNPPTATADMVAIVKDLNSVLANEFGIFTKTLNYHWNVTGPRFHSLHQFLETHYKDLLVIMDEVAERARIIHGRPLSTAQELREAMRVEEHPGSFPSANEMLADLMKDHSNQQMVIKKILAKEDFGDDPGTEDFLVGLLQKHEKMTWMLRSHLE